MRAKQIEFVEDESGCHICTSHATIKGYPRITRYGQRFLLHRFIYQEKYGPLTTGDVIRHLCDNTLCINIDHLLKGTQADNMHDKVLRGRSPIGELNNRCKLTYDDVRLIREDDILGNLELSQKFGVSRSQIWKIKHGKRWAAA